MISQKALKHYASLLHKKQRQKEKKFIVEGNKLLTEGIENGYTPEIVLTTLTFFESQPEYFESLNGLRIEHIKSQELKKLTDTKSPQEVIAVFPYANKQFNSDSVRSKLIVYLDNISDPGNTGTIIRNCDWFGVTEVILSEESVELYNPKVVRSSMGSVFHIKVFEDVSIDNVKELKAKGYKIICSDLEGQDIFDYKLPDKSVLVLSNEAHGPSEKIRKLSDHIISIKRKGKAESLNVASASAVILSLLTK
jgi:TrmH family RNA methyltransferase